MATKLILIVYCHPYTHSFNHAVLTHLEKNLTRSLSGDMSGTTPALLKISVIAQHSSNIAIRSLTVFFRMNTPEKRYTASELWYHKARLEHFNKVIVV